MTFCQKMRNKILILTYRFNWRDKMTRKIIQICESAMEECSNISALCDDGTVWYLNDIRKGWAKYPNIPQDTQEEQPQAAN